jgi:hypothetical protein
MQLHWKCPTISHMSQWYGCYLTLSSIARHGHQTGRCSTSTRQKNARLVNIFVPQLWARILAGVHVCSITSAHGAHTLMASVQMRWNTSWLLWCTCLWHRSKQNGFWRMRLQLTSQSCLLGEFSYLLLAMILDICMGKDCAPTRSAKSKVISVWRASPQSKQNTWIFRARRQEKRPSYLLALRGAWLCL